MSVQVTPTYKGFEVRFDYNPAIVEAIKTIPNAQWRGNHKFWYIPKHRTNELDMFLEKFGIMTEPVIQMPEQVGELPELPELDTPLSLVRPPFPFQAKGIARGIEFNGRFLCGDQPGLGKTTTAIGTVEALQCKCVLIICPPTLKFNWQNEIRIVAGKRSLILDDKNKAKWINYHKVGMVNYFIVNYEGLKKFFVKPGWKKPKGMWMVKDIPFRDNIHVFDAVILDESHKIKDSSTMQSKLCIGIGLKKRVRIALSGTPIINNPKDLVPQLVFLGRLSHIVSHISMSVTNGREDKTGINRFINRYCEGGIGATNLNELNYRLNKTCFFRREKKEVLKELPDKIRQLVYCDITNWNEYIKAEQDFESYLYEVKGCTDIEVEKKLRGEMMVKIGVLKQISARGKIEAAKEYIEEIADGGEKVVVFYEHNEILNELQNVFPNSARVSGLDKLEVRKKGIEAFQNNKNVNKIFCNLQAGGVGITLTASSEVLLIEQPWTDALIEQAIDRTHRIGQTNKVRAGILLGRNTIDEYVYSLIIKKRDIAAKVTGSKIDTDEIIDGLFSYFDRKKKQTD